MNGDEYREEGSKELFEKMKHDGIVAAYPASDDLIILNGAFYDETGHSYTPLDYKTGVMVSECEGDDCPYYKRVSQKRYHMYCNWVDEKGWVVELYTPSGKKLFSPFVETFDIVETNPGGERGEILEHEPYGTGIVFHRNLLNQETLQNV